MSTRKGPKPSKPRNPVAQHSNEFNKPQTHRDRKKDEKRRVADEELRHPHAQPYHREHRNLLKDAEEKFFWKFMLDQVGYKEDEDEDREGS